MFYRAGGRWQARPGVAGMVASGECVQVVDPEAGGCAEVGVCGADPAGSAAVVQAQVW